MKLLQKQHNLPYFLKYITQKGWNAYINNEPAEYIRVNYVLRAIPIPPGNNKIEFKFEPSVVKTGSTISLASSILFLLVILGALVYRYRNRKNRS